MQKVLAESDETRPKIMSMFKIKLKSHQTIKIDELKRHKYNLTVVQRIGKMKTEG